MKKKTTLTKIHIAPSTVRYDAVAARDSNEVGQILAGTRKRNGYSLVAFSELLRHYGVDVSDKGISKWEKGYTTPSIYQLVAIDRKSTRLNSSHTDSSRMPSSA